jgi:hypothetical protein
MQSEFPRKGRARTGSVPEAILFANANRSKSVDHSRKRAGEKRGPPAQPFFGIEVFKSVEKYF